ncbi:MAG: glutamate--tRNA ligase family protein [Planctomycetota bacterium]
MAAASNIRVRFAPSPTGHVHIGNIRVCIYNWLFARNQGGTMLLRIEDTDRERSTPEAVATMLDALEWLGLDYDEPPVYQSRRLDRYREVAAKLLADGHAYYSDKGAADKGQALVFRVTEDAEFEDVILGRRGKLAKDMTDFVIMKSDNTPVFHLANVIDDMDSGITHILRGNDHVENTYRHVMLFKALGKTPPVYAHFPMIINKDGKPYSKRDGDAYVGDFKARGFLPEALVNFLALCGWSPGDDREFLPPAELVRVFDLRRVRKSPAQFNMKKMEGMNRTYLQALGDDALAAALRPFAGEAGLDLDRFTGARRTELLQLFKAKLGTLADFPVKARFVFHADFTYDREALDKFVLDAPGRALWPKLCAVLRDAPDFTEATLTAPLTRVMEAAGVNFLRIAQPIRIALTGGTVSPGIFETMSFLGREEVLRRIDRMQAEVFKET